MHENFVYSSTSQLLQVTFWHAYRDFFTNPNTVEPLLSASEVIKNVTVAFPGASAKVWVDERGENKFVIAGMGFRKSNGEFGRSGAGFGSGRGLGSPDAYCADRG
jgi:chromatin structure-remodeling complex subunit RSC9